MLIHVRHGFLLHLSNLSPDALMEGTVSYFCNKKTALCLLSDFLFIDTHSKFCLSDRTSQNAKVGESFQVEGNWVCKTDADWFSKCQAVILSNKSHNHNRRGSLSSSCWKRRYLRKKEKKKTKKKYVSSTFLFCLSPQFLRFLHFCFFFYNDRYNLDIPDFLNQMTGKKYLH